LSRAASLTPLDAWVLARLLAGRDVEGWLDRVSESTRSLARALGSQPLETRSMTWQCHMDRLEGPDGPQEWTAVVAAVDPEGPAPPVAEPAQRFRLVRLADAEPQPVEWLWPDRIAIGKVTTIAGDPGLGKSFLTLWLASLLSRGGAFPDRPGEPIEPGETILLSAEDDVNDTIRPRLDVAGADVSRVFALTTGATADGSFAPFDLTTDIPGLEEILGQKPDVRLLVIDPVSAYLGETDENKNGQIRGLMTPLSDLASRHRIAVVLVTHMNKATGLKAIYRATGSLAFVAAARTVWLVAKDPGNAH
jgi:RecA-family ATPase